MSRKKKKGKIDNVLGEILALIGKSNKPMATQEIADLIEKPWHSVQTRCLKLQIDGKIMGFRVGRINLWQVISPRKETR